jgi:hypothetical protein
VLARHADFAQDGASHADAKIALHLLRALAASLEASLIAALGAIISTRNEASAAPKRPSEEPKVPKMERWRGGTRSNGSARPARAPTTGHTGTISRGALPVTALPVTALPVTALSVTALPVTALPVTALPLVESLGEAAAAAAGVGEVGPYGPRGCSRAPPICSWHAWHG